MVQKFYQEILEKPEEATMEHKKVIDFIQLEENEICPVVTLKMQKSKEKLDENQEYYHAVTLERSVVQDSLVTVTLSDSRPNMDKTTVDIPLSMLSDYDAGKPFVFDGGEGEEVEEWSLGDDFCYYLVFH